MNLVVKCASMVAAALVFAVPAVASAHPEGGRGGGGRGHAVGHERGWGASRGYERGWAAPRGYGLVTVVTGGVHRGTQARGTSLRTSVRRAARLTWHRMLGVVAASSRPIVPCTVGSRAV